MFTQEVIAEYILLDAFLIFTTYVELNECFLNNHRIFMTISDSYIFISVYQYKNIDVNEEGEKESQR